jgi:NADH-quinone oxidoreductase subunit H
MIENLFKFIVFPGFIFSSTMGLLAGWFDRKITARLQWRIGPPWYQNFMDIAKLFLKETLMPRGASKAIFFSMPIFAIAGATLASTIILVINQVPENTFIGDLIVAVYLMIIPALALMLGGFASGNPLASVGGSREMKLMLSYELPLLLALVVPIVRADYSIQLGGIITYQASAGPIFFSVSGVLSFIVMLFCIQAKLGLTPFDMAEAETEIASGPYIDYSGKALAMLKIAKAILTFALPVLLITLYFGGIKFTVKGILTAVLQYILILFLMVVIKNTNPRVRIDQAVRFFWRIPTVLAILAVVLVYLKF